MALKIGQLSGRVSLRDLVDTITARKRSLYHPGMKALARSNPARINEKQPAALYESMFGKLLAHCKAFAPVANSNSKSRSIFLTPMATLCLSLFPWAHYIRTKGAIKMHGLDANGYLPTFLSMPPGKVHEIEWAGALQLPEGSFVVFDRGVTDYNRYVSLIKNEILFVAQLKNNVRIQLGWKRSGRKATGIHMDREIFPGYISESLRLVENIPIRKRTLSTVL